MFGVLGEVLLNGTLLGQISERERLKVVLQAEIVVRVGRVLLHLLDEPHVTISGEEELARDLVHIMLAHDTTPQAIFQLLLNVLILVLGDHVHDQRCFGFDVVSEAVDLEESELRHISPRPRRVSRLELKIED